MVTNNTSRTSFGRRSIHTSGTVTVPKQARRMYDFPEEGQVEVEYDPAEGALVYRPVESQD